MSLVRYQPIRNASRNGILTGPFPTTNHLPADTEIKIVEYQVPTPANNVVYGTQRANQVLSSSSGIMVQYVVAVADKHTNELWTCQMTPELNYIDVNNGTHKIETSVYPGIVQITYSQVGIFNEVCPTYEAKISIFIPSTRQTNLTNYNVCFTLKCVTGLGERVCARRCEEVSPSAIRPVQKIRVKGSLITGFGRHLIKEFQTLVDMGNYEEICQKREHLARCVNENDPHKQDLVCLALLEEADACLTQRTMEEAKNTAKKAFCLLEKWHCYNALIIRSYFYIVLAVAARVNKEFEEAEEYLEQANQEIEPMEACEFKSYAPYNYGTLIMDKIAVRGASVSDEAEKQKARRAFRDAVAYSSNEHENHMLPRILNRNVSFLLQTTPNKVPDVNIEVPAEDIAEAEALLTSLERDVFPRFPRANWARTLYRLNKCDFYTRCGSLHEAIEEARICIDMAERFGGLSQKKQAAEDRIQILRDLQSLDELPAL